MASTFIEDPSITRDESTILDDKRFLEDGDHERYSHYVKKNLILESAMSGKPVKALVARSGRRVAIPKSAPSAPECKDIDKAMLN